MSKPTNDIDKEIKTMLQMIPHHADRRKFRGLIQRVRTFERKKLTNLEKTIREDERDKLCRSALDKHTLDFLPSWYEDKVKSLSTKEEV